MSTSTVDSGTPNIELPAVRPVTMASPLRWLRLGARDLRAGWPISLAYGALFAGLGFGLVNYAWGHMHLALTFTSGFLLVAPFLALGFVEVSRRLEHHHRTLRGERLHFAVLGHNGASIGLYAVALAFVLSVWERISALLAGLFLRGDVVMAGYFDLAALFSREQMVFVAAYLLVGAALAALVFALSVVSLPMMLDRRVDPVTAMVTSLEAVRVNPLPMLVWAGLIAGLTLVGILTWYVGLMVIFPLLGHATWHAYRDLVGR